MVELYLHSRIYCNEFDQRVARQQLCKDGPLRNNRMNIYSSLLDDSQRANGLTRSVSRDFFSVVYAIQHRTVFSVRGMCSVLIREVNSDAKSDQGSYE
jgi:hypothetical protein